MDSRQTDAARKPMLAEDAALRMGAPSYNDA